MRCCRKHPRKFSTLVVGRATGRGLVAEQILAIAFERGIKVREDANLANVLAALELETPIPVGVLSTVAEILSYVYRANRTAWADPKGAR